MGGVGGVREGEAGGGGYVVLEMPVKLSHAEGTKVANGRPGRVEAAAYRKRQARSYILSTGYTLSFGYCSHYVPSRRYQAQAFRGASWPAAHAAVALQVRRFFSRTSLPLCLDVL